MRKRFLPRDKQNFGDLVGARARSVEGRPGRAPRNTYTIYILAHDAQEKSDGGKALVSLYRSAKGRALVAF